MGSNITNERLRFDFKHPQKIEPAEIQQIESVINQKIDENLPVHRTIEPKQRALQSGALAFFNETYPDKVSVYTIGGHPETDWYSKELCGGPHVSSTGEIGPVTIKKEQSVGSGVRRIYLTFKPVTR
jgi:alanyl-tRNA synthetase